MAIQFKKVTGFIIGMGIITSISTTAFAQQNNLADRLKNASARVNELVQANASYMSQQDQQEALELLRMLRDKIKNGTGSQPQPGYPNQPQPPPQYPGSPSMSIRGALERSEFTFNVRDLYDLHNQCVSFVKISNQNKIDDITLSINYGPIKTLRNSSSYWTGANEICMNLINEARLAGLVASTLGEKIYIGRVENVDFTFVARSIPDLGQQCENFVRANSLLKVDDINVSVNFGTTRSLRNSSSYWNGSLEVCQQIINAQ